MTMEHLAGVGAEVTYVLPIRRSAPMPTDELSELTRYLETLSPFAEVIVVDGSPASIYGAHHMAWRHVATHVPTHPALRTTNGKVGNVLTGLRLARHERLVIADDDVRYSIRDLMAVARLLDSAEVVRPQNYFDPVPWHALWDTGRSLLNRVTGGDWPGTLAVRRSALQSTGGYDGDVLFENLELVRTIVAAGGRELVAYDVFVARRPPPARHFWSQRVRQAYDEFARPWRMAIWLSLLLATLALLVRREWRVLSVLIVVIVALAEAGRRRAGGSRVFPMLASILAPTWVLERAVCAWLAVATRITRGGVRYRDTIIRRAATPTAKLERRYSGAGEDASDGAPSAAPRHTAQEPHVFA